METGKPACVDLLLGRGRNPGICDYCDFDWQRVLKNSILATTDAFDRNVAHPAGLLRIYSTAFLHDVVSIGRQVVQSLNQPARPADYDLVRFRRLTQTEMQPQVALRNVAVATANFFLALIGSLLERDRGAQGGAV